MKKIIMILLLVFILTSCAIEFPNDEEKLYNVTISSSIENGSVTVDKSKVKAGETITLNVLPNDGYEFSYFTVLEVIYKTKSFIFINKILLKKKIDI